MKLTRATCYALHALAYMASQKNVNKAVASHIVAQEKGIPKRFLLKVLKPLVTHNILSSVKGPKGGYRLARPASDITLLEIIEAGENGRIIGKAEPPTPKPEDKAEFPNFKPENIMPLHKKLDNLCRQAADGVRKQFDKIKLSDLIKR